MQATMDETDRRREKQIAYNTEHGLVPTALKKSREAIMEQTTVAGTMKRKAKYDMQGTLNRAAEQGLTYMSADELKDRLAQTRKAMESAAKDLDFVEAAKFRDEMRELEKALNGKA
jgi:excinuclease ABC subunit B